MNPTQPRGPKDHVEGSNLQVVPYLREGFNFQWRRKGLVGGGGVANDPFGQNFTQTPIAFAKCEISQLYFLLRKLFIRDIQINMV